MSFQCDICKTLHEGSAISAIACGSSYGRSVFYTEGEGFRDYEYLCEKCYVDINYNNVRWCECPICKDRVSVRHMNWMLFTIDGEHAMCNVCVRERTFYCGSCHVRQPYFATTHHRTRRDSYVCGDCLVNYRLCDHCEYYVHKTLMSAQNENVCRDCWHIEHPPKRIIHDYNFRPPMLIFHGGKAGDRKRLFFGCELEVYVANNYDLSEKGEEVLELMNGEKWEEHVYLKSDSSIGRGFEIVTHPHSWDEITKLWTEKWSEKIEGVSSHTSGTCGFHVHVSRKALTPMHIQKLVVFINAPENADLVRQIAQRNCQSYAVLKPNKKIGHCSHNDDRYEAINLQNEHTIEFRIFRGNTRKARILKNLEFVKSAIEFTRDRSYRDLSAGNFRKFVAGQEKEYRHLQRYLLEDCASSNFDL